MYVTFKIVKIRVKLLKDVTSYYYYAEHVKKIHYQHMSIKSHK